MFKWLISSVLKCFFKKPKLQNEVEVISYVAWWSYQNQMTISSVEFDIGELNMHLFKPDTIIGYRVSGTLKGKAKWRPKIGKVHINERFLHPDPYMPKISWAVSNQESIEEAPEENNTDPEALITITPIVQVEHDEEYNEEEISFTFRNELRIRSFHWGENRLRIQCRDIYKDISWHQRKSSGQKN